MVGTTNGGVQYPHELKRYCLPILNMYLCLSSFTSFTKENLVLVNVDKKFGIGSDPPTPYHIAVLYFSVSGMGNIAQGGDPL